MVIIVVFLGLVILAALLTGAYNLLLALWHKTTETRRAVATMQLDVERQRVNLHKDRLQITQQIWPDPETGTYPALWDGARLLDISRGALFTFESGTEALTPGIARPEQIRRILAAAGGWPPGSSGASLLAEPEHEEAWPRANLLELFRNQTPTIHNLVIGVTHNRDIISASLHDLMHVLNVGASGWGKSTWLRSLLWQIALAQEPIEVIAIDINGSEFNILRDWSKLRYPVARTTADAIALLGEVTGEIARRGELYEMHPLATKLTEYNQASGENLPPWVVTIDEGTNLLNQTGIGEPLRATVQTARQYGIYVLLAGQSAKHSVIDTQIRDNFSTRLCFRTSPSSSRVVLDSRDAGDLNVKGRAYVQLVGRELLEVQGPFISRESFYKGLNDGGPQHAMPVPPDNEPDEQQRILALDAEGLSKRQIQMKVFGYTGGKAFDVVSMVLSGTTTDQAHNDDQDVVAV